MFQMNAVAAAAAAQFPAASGWRQQEPVGLQPRVSVTSGGGGPVSSPGSTYSRSPASYGSSSPEHRLSPQLPPHHHPPPAAAAYLLPPHHPQLPPPPHQLPPYEPLSTFVGAPAHARATAGIAKPTPVLAGGVAPPAQMMAPLLPGTEEEYIETHITRRHRHHSAHSPGAAPDASPAGSSGDGSAVAGAGPCRFQCSDCKKSYSTFSGLSKHRQFHCVTHVRKSFACKFCQKSYVSLGALKMHIRTHTLPCKCKLCGKAFSRPWLLQGHVRTHTGEKPFSCEHCGRAFADRSNLRAHLQTHSDVKKYRCEGCCKTFSRMSLLVKHRDGNCLGVRMMGAAGGSGEY